MLKFLHRPYPFFLNDNTKNILLILFTSIFIALFLTLYVPFENPNNTLPINIGWGALVFIALFVNIILLPKFTPALFDFSKWTIQKHLLYLLWLFFCMGLLFSIVNLIFYCDCSGLTYFQVFLKTQKEVVLTGIFPLVIVTVLAKNNMLRQNLADAINANKAIHEIQTIQENPKPINHKITIYTDTSETFDLDLTLFSFAIATDNYTEVYWNEGQKMSKKLLRVTLKNVESQLTNQFIVRCHRSYLVNVKAIESISGNTNGYKLKVKYHSEEIPVSRAKGKEIIAHIQQIRDLMDLS